MIIKVGIVGYGNLGRGVESALRQNPDMELVGVFTRRKPENIEIYTKGVKIYHIDEALKLKDSIDVMILCGGSAKDLPEQTPEFAKYFNVVDSFDNHTNIPRHFAAVNSSSIESNKVSIISVGWDPGLFSLNRVYGQAVLPEGVDYTFWGKGVSQGHSDALRRVEGVRDGKQYTIPIEEALESVRQGETPKFTSREKHFRECFVVAEDGADREKIEEEIINMPNYFSDYNTRVNFVSEEELLRDHKGIPHGGFVIRSGKSGFEKENKQIIEYSLKLESNPEFTASVLTAYARAAYRMYKEGQKGCKTVFDVALAYLTIESNEDLRRKYL